MSAKIITIDTNEKLEDLVAASHNAPVFLLKHSNTCGISADILEQLREVAGDINIIVVQNSRAISNAVADQFGIRHASPQAFVIKDGKVIYHATHYGIDPRSINKNLGS